MLDIKLKAGCRPSRGCLVALCDASRKSEFRPYWAISIPCAEQLSVYFDMSTPRSDESPMFRTLYTGELSIVMIVVGNEDEPLGPDIDFAKGASEHLLQPCYDVVKIALCA